MRTHRRIATAAALALLGAASPVTAQQWGTVEAGVHVQRTLFADVLTLDDAFGVGGSLGLFIFRNLALEAEITITPTEGDLPGEITYRPWAGRLMYNVPLSEKLRLMLGAGYVQGVYAGDNSENEFEDGFHAIGGIKYYLTPSWALRIAGTADRFPSPANIVDKTDKSGFWNYGLRAGLSWSYPPVEECVAFITATPADSVRIGQSVAFTAGARGEKTGRAWSTTQTYTVTPSGSVTNGSFTPTQAGAYTVTARSQGRGCDETATATVRAYNPDTLQRIVIAPKESEVLRGDTVRFTVRGVTSMGRDTAVTPTWEGGDVQNGVFRAGDDSLYNICAVVTPPNNQALRDCATVRVRSLVSVVVNFDLSADSLDSQARAKIDSIIGRVRGNPSITLRVEGHADTIPPRGVRNDQRSKTFNTQLSLRRADNVSSYLLNQGVETARFEPRISGFSFCLPQVPHRAPADYEKDEQGRPLGERANRRVEIFILAMPPGEQMRWVCSGQLEPLATKPPAQR